MTLTHDSRDERRVTGSPGLGVLRRLRPVPTRSADGGPSPYGDAGGVARGEDRNGSRVHSSITRRRRRPTRPLRHRRGYPAALHRGLPIGLWTLRRVPHPVMRGRVRVASGPDPPGSSRHHIEGRRRRFLAYAFPSRLPDPHHLAVLTRPGFVRAAPTPPRHLPELGCPQLRSPAATEPRCRSLTSTRSTSASRRTHRSW
jgi:hypothetical protein